MRIQAIRDIAALFGALAAATLAPMAAAQENGHGGIVMQRAMLTTIVRGCSEAYPQLAPSLQTQLDAWQAEHADASAAADAFIAGLTPEQRTNVDQLVRKVQQTANDLLTSAQRQTAGEEYCAGAFESFGTLGKQGYYDAENVGEAVGMYHTKMITAEIAREMCVARYPQLQSRADEALGEWRKRDASIAAVVESHMNRMRRANPSAAKDMEDMMDRNVRELLSTAIDNGNETYCRKYFDDLTADQHRLQTPKMYQFLEQESPAR